MYRTTHISFIREIGTQGPGVPIIKSLIVFPTWCYEYKSFPTQLEKEFINHSCQINESEKIFKKLFHINKIGNKAKG